MADDERADAVLHRFEVAPMGLKFCGAVIEAVQKLGSGGHGALVDSSLNESDSWGIPYGPKQ